MCLTLKQESCSLDEPNRLFVMFTCQYGDDGDYNTAEQMALMLRQGLPDHPRKAQIIDNRWLGYDPSGVTALVRVSQKLHGYLLRLSLGC